MLIEIVLCARPVWDIFTRKIQTQLGIICEAAEDVCPPHSAGDKRQSRAYAQEWAQLQLHWRDHGQWIQISKMSEKLPRTRTMEIEKWKGPDREWKNGVTLELVNTNTSRHQLQILQNPHWPFSVCIRASLLPFTSTSRRGLMTQSKDPERSEWKKSCSKEGS